MTYQAITAVGRDCDCGHPLIWSRGRQLCAVYGTHAAPDVYVHWRNLDAPGAALVDASLAMCYQPTRPTLRVVV